MKGEHDQFCKNDMWKCKCLYCANDKFDCCNNHGVTICPVDDCKDYTPEYETKQSEKVEQNG